MASFHSKDSFLRRAPVRGLYLDINELPRIPKSRGDQLYEIEHQYEYRPDLLANELFGLSLIHISEPTRPERIAYGG